MMFSHLFPKLTDENSVVTSVPAFYNCIAWATGRSDVWIEPSPGCEWPEGVERQFTPENVRLLFGRLGYKECDGKEFEPGFLKVAIYELDGECSHASRQLPDGKWTSKLGIREDIQHECPFDLEGEEYGRIRSLMKRPVG